MDYVFDICKHSNWKDGNIKYSNRVIINEIYPDKSMKPKYTEITIRNAKQKLEAHDAE